MLSFILYPKEFVPGIFNEIVSLFVLLLETFSMYSNLGSKIKV